VTREAYFAAAPFFLQSDMNVFRSLLWRPLVLASFEHSTEAAVRGFAAFFSAVAAFAAGAGEAGGVVWAKAEPIKSKDAKAVAAAREDKVVIGSPRVEKTGKVSRAR